MTIMLFLPVATLRAEDEWEWYMYADSNQSPDYYRGWDGHTYKEVDITEQWCEREFDEENGTGFWMLGVWNIYVEAEVGSYEERYTNIFMLEGEVFHYCEEDWEWSGAPGTAPGATVEYTLYAEGSQKTEGYRWIASPEAYTTASGSIWCNAYSWPHDSQSYGYLDVNAGLSGNVSNYSHSGERYWYSTPEQDTPDGDEHSDEDDFVFSFVPDYYWYFEEEDEYEVAQGLGTFSANGGVYGSADATVGIIAYEGETGDTWVIDNVYIGAMSTFTMTSN